MTAPCVVLDVRGRNAAGHAWRRIVRCPVVEDAFTLFGDDGLNYFKIIASDDGMESRAMQARGCPPPFVDLAERGGR